MAESLVKPNRPVFTDLAGLAAMVADGDRFGVGGHHFARLPIALLLAVAGRGVRDLRYTAWAGGLPLEILLEAGAVASIDICFSSLDIFGLPPRFRAAAEAERLPVRDWTALAMIEALRAAQQNLPSRTFQLPAGSAMMARIPGAPKVPDPLSAARSAPSRRSSSTRCCCMRRAPTRAATSRSSAPGRSTSPWSARRGRCWSRSRRSCRSARSPLPAARP